MLPDKLWEWAKEEWADVKKLPFTLVVSIFVAIIGTSYASSCWYAERIETLTVQRDGFEAELAKLAPPEPPRVALDLNCERRLMPAAPTFNDHLNVYFIDRADQGGRELTRIFGSKTPEQGVPSAIRCQVFNRGNVPVVNAWLDIDVVFRAVERPSGQIVGSGVIVGTHQRTFIVPGVFESGGDQPQTFWIKNNTDLYVFASIRERMLVSASDGRTLLVNFQKFGEALNFAPMSR